MRKIAVLGAALAASVMTAPVALAQDARQPVDITFGKACGAVTLTFVNPETDVSKTHGFRWNAVAGDKATGDGARTGLVTVGPGETVKETIRFEEDEFGGTASVTVAVAFGPDSDIQKRLDIYPVDTDCSEDSVEPTPTEDPEPTETPEPIPTEEPEPLDPSDLDCGDFPLAEGRTAQQVLDADQNDPHALDEDGDLVACEADDPAANPTADTTPAPSDDSSSGDVVTPQGGVNTGGGPA
jgi:hypothetical protein